MLNQSVPPPEAQIKPIDPSASSLEFRRRELWSLIRQPVRGLLVALVVGKLIDLFLVDVASFAAAAVFLALLVFRVVLWMECPASLALDEAGVLRMDTRDGVVTMPVESCRVGSLCPIPPFGLAIRRIYVPRRPEVDIRSTTGHVPESDEVQRFTLVDAFYLGSLGGVTGIVPELQPLQS